MTFQVLLELECWKLQPLVYHWLSHTFSVRRETDGQYVVKKHTVQQAFWSVRSQYSLVPQFELIVVVVTCDVDYVILVTCDERQARQAVETLRWKQAAAGS